MGISPDPVERLSGFRAEHGLPFPLLSDPDHQVAEAYGAWGTKKMYGREYQGILRSTFVIDPEGRIVKTGDVSGPVTRVRITDLRGGDYVLMVLDGDTSTELPIHLRRAS